MAVGGMLRRMLMGRRVLPLLAVACALGSAPIALAGRGAPTARRFGGIPQVGAVFPTSLIPEHICTASVVSSPHGNVILTAAHCILGTGVGFVFAPGFHNGVSPYGKWSVTAAHVAPGWSKNRNPRDDFAFLDVAPRRIGGRLRQIQQLTGAIRLGSTPRPRQWVTIPAYPIGAANDPITCTVRVYFTGPYPSFNCNPYVDGTSGAPWISGRRRHRRIVGLIGGLHQGGCHSYTSYSPPFGAEVMRVYRAAISGTPGNVIPPAGSDGCS